MKDDSLVGSSFLLPPSSFRREERRMRQRDRLVSHGSRPALALLALALATLTGCARSVVTTEIEKDGKWKRTLKFYAGASQKEGQEDGPLGRSGETLDSAFVLTKGLEWKTSRA